MKQNQTKIQIETQNQTNDLKETFENIKKTETHRRIRLYFRSCCGCGCYDVQLERIVPFDSPLQDGDHIPSSQVLESDKLI